MIDIRPEKLFRQLLIFNFSPLSYMHPTRIAQEIKNIGIMTNKDAILNTARIPFSKLILKKYNIHNKNIFAFNHPSSYIALIPYKEIIRISNITSLILLHKNNKILSSDKLAILKKDISFQDIQYSFNLAPKLKNKSLPANLTKNIRQISKECITTWLSEETISIKQRVIFKFPADYNFITYIQDKNYIAILKNIFSYVATNFMENKDIIKYFP